ncbi:hypothetical protein GH714_005069 [Hevea brasiliensis]|uniref:Uncharacterized protein n=1 Tax=Hevea brasiliensis TaxID=3981 RepID=A0A6A6LJQ9_HEVBR|nr:hypothetical protein GH714_005069 [Hevea brasiliensis]
MSDDMLIHFSSNSSNQSDQSLPTKIAKLEARMVGRGRGSRGNDQMRSQISSSAASASNGQLENSCHKEEVASLCAKVAALEEELRKSRQEASDKHNLCHQLEKELKELKDYEQQMKPKRTKMISDLLISVSKAERQEARMKVRQDSLRLGNVGVIRYGLLVPSLVDERGKKN